MTNSSKNGRESYLFDRATISDIQRAAKDGIYKIGIRPHNITTYKVNITLISKNKIRSKIKSFTYFGLKEQ